jgi:hypothetical protein
MTRDCVAPAAIDTSVKVALTTRPLAVIGEFPVIPIAGEVLSPVPEAVATKFPLVAVIAPLVAVTVVVAVIDPGATRVEGRLRVIVEPLPTVEISFEVPAI